MTSPPDETPPPFSSSPEFDLSPPALPPPPASDLKRIWLGISLVLLLLSARSLFGGNRDEMQERGERLEKIMAALRLTKYVYVTQSVLSSPSAKPSRPASSGSSSNPGKEAIELWRKLTASSTARVTDWRRLGITQAVFGQKNEALATFRKIAQLPPALREGEPKTEREKKRARPEDRIPWADISPAQEVAFWEALYGPKPLAKAEVPRLRAALEKLELNWFAHLALDQLYTKAGMAAEAEGERTRALETAEGVVGWTVWQFFLVITGIIGLAISGARLWHLSQKKQAARLDAEKRLLPPLVPPPAAGDPFPYRARMLAFLSYFAIPLLTIPFASLLQEQTASLSMQGLARLSVGLYLFISVGSILFSLWMLRRLAHAARPEQPVLSPRTTLAQLGFRARSLPAEIGAGLLGYAMLMPLLLIIGFLSSLLFSRFKTPPHPVLFQFLTISSPLDQALLLLQTAVAAAVTEEVMFRGVFYPALKARYGVAKAIALSSAVFALAHPTLPGGFLPLWLMGASFALIYERRGSLLPGIVMHALNNGMLLLAQFSTFAK